MNPLFNGSQPTPMSPIQNGNFMNQIQQFASMINGNPQQIVQNLLNSGRMSQQQFQQYAQMANSLTGRH